MSFWVYILRCSDGSYYTGHTDDLEKRIGEHQTGAIPSCYTFKRRPLQLVFSQACAIREEALAAEQQIKGWGRKKKEAMMRGDWAEVSRLAKSKTPVRPEPSTPVRPETSISVRPEPVEGHLTNSVHPSTSSGRTEISVRPETSTPVRPEPVEGHLTNSVHPSTSSGRTEDEVSR